VAVFAFAFAFHPHLLQRRDCKRFSAHSASDKIGVSVLQLMNFHWSKTSRDGGAHQRRTPPLTGRQSYGHRNHVCSNGNFNFLDI
jgi:hypothetical protein